MALRAQSLLLYGFQVTVNNRSLDFKTAAMGSEKQATLRLGYYSLTSLMTEIVRAMNEADPSNTFNATANRTFNSGRENRVTISTSASYLSLLFLTGTRNASSCRTLIGFNNTDYTGLTSYQGNSSAGIAVVSEKVGYNYMGPEFIKKVFGAVNVSADGSKESIVFQVQKFLQVQFKYEPQAKVISQWQGLFTWAIQQRPYEFTPEITTPTTFYEVTLESTGADGKGLGFEIKEMLPNFPFDYDTGLIRMRQIVPPGGFL